MEDLAPFLESVRQKYNLPSLGFALAVDGTPDQVAVGHAAKR